MKLSKEAIIWVKQEENRIKSCEETKNSLKRQKALINDAIKLENEQIALIKKGITTYKKEWKVFK